MKKLVVFFTALLATAAAHADPVSAIAAIGSMVASGGAAAIASGGLAALGGLTLTQGLMFAGGALNLVGNLTGNKKLAKVGGVLGIAGGIGQAASSLANAAGQGAAETVSAGAEKLSQTAATPAAEAAGGVATEAATEAAGGLAGEGVGQAAEAGAAAAQDSATKAALFGDKGYGAAGGAPLVDEAASRGILSQVGGFIRDNKELVNLGSGLIGGAMKGQSERDILAERARLEEEARRRFDTSVRGVAPQGQFIRGGVDVTSGRPVQNPVRYQSRTAGLIRNAQGA